MFVCLFSIHDLNKLGSFSYQILYPKCLVLFLAHRKYLLEEWINRQCSAHWETLRPAFTYGWSSREVYNTVENPKNHSLRTVIKKKIESNIYSSRSNNAVDSLNCFLETEWNLYVKRSYIYLLTSQAIWRLMYPGSQEDLSIPTS